MLYLVAGLGGGKGRGGGECPRSRLFEYSALLTLCLFFIPISSTPVSNPTPPVCTRLGGLFLIVLLLTRMLRVGHLLRCVGDVGEACGGGGGGVLRPRL